MRLLFLVLFVLLGLIQYPLWLGKGGWFKVWDLQHQVTAQRETNEGLRARNAALEAEVRDLEVGSGAVEERARGELGMMRDGEVFVHISPPNATPSGNAGSISGAPAPAIHTNAAMIPKPAPKPPPKPGAAAPKPATAPKPAVRPASQPAATGSPANRQ